MARSTSKSKEGEQYRGITVRVSPDEHQLLSLMATGDRTTLSEWVAEAARERANRKLAKGFENHVTREIERLAKAMSGTETST